MDVRESQHLCSWIECPVHSHTPTKAVADALEHAWRGLGHVARFGERLRHDELRRQSSLRPLAHADVDEHAAELTGPTCVIARAVHHLAHPCHASLGTQETIFRLAVSALVSDA